MIGQTIGHYQITGKLGEGGMGVVYRATDSRLGREVAIKVLPPAVANDHDRLVRFEREARTLASLNHPNIAAIYGVEDGALVMELVEGAALHCPVAEETAIAYARQIADALEHAHEKGVVHRDLKPANIRITPEGALKLLDFGLAKAMEAAPSTANPENSPTLTQNVSVSGVIMGTVGYMSPEQARGQRVDHRTDIWAFGVVLHEMLTGRALFKGETVSDTLAALLTKDPDLQAVPERFRPLIARCLERDLHQRLGWIGEARRLLETPEKPPQRATARASKLPWIAAGLLAALAGFAWMRAPQSASLPERRLSIAAPGLTISTDILSVAISPDSRRIAYIAANQLWIRDLDREEPRLVENSEGATAPFWSPDSQFLGFVVRKRLWKVSVEGGRPVDLAEASFQIRGAAWESDGRNIVSTGGLSINRVPAEGGKMSPTFLESESGKGYFHLKVIPGTHLLLSSTIRAPRIVLLDLEANKMEELGISGYAPVYSPTGHILYTVPAETRGADIWALPFSLRARKASGPPFPAIRGAALPSVGADGFIVCTDPAFSRIVLRDREGNLKGNLPALHPMMTDFAVSPDRKRVAVTVFGEGKESIWIHDLANGVGKRLTSDTAFEYSPKWSPDGKSVAYTADENGQYRVLLRNVDSSVVSTVRLATKDRIILDEWSADGRFLFYTEGAAASRKVGYFEKRSGESGSGYDRVTLQEKDSRYPRLSPDGRYYLHQGAGQHLIVRPFPSGPESWQVSVDAGANWPRWSRDGREIYFVANGEMMAAEVSTQGAFSASRPKLLFHAPQLVGINQSAARLEVMPDGSFAMIEPVPPASSRAPAIQVIENWRPGGRANYP